LNKEVIAAKAFISFIRVYSLFKSEWLSTNIKLTLHKALIRFIMTYACPVCEFALDNHLMKLQHRKTRFFAPLIISQGAHQSAICTWLSNFQTYMII
jgi:hypothetical protein